MSSGSPLTGWMRERNRARRRLAPVPGSGQYGPGWLTPLGTTAERCAKARGAKLAGFLVGRGTKRSGAVEYRSLVSDHASRFSRPDGGEQTGPACHEGSRSRGARCRSTARSARQPVREPDAVVVDEPAGPSPSRESSRESAAEADRRPGVVGRALAWLVWTGRTRDERPTWRSAATSARLLATSRRPLRPASERCGRPAHTGPGSWQTTSSYTSNEDRGQLPRREVADDVCPGCGRPSLAGRFIGQKTPRCRGEGAGVADGREVAGHAVDDARSWAAAVGAHDGDPARHGFEQHDSEASSSEDRARAPPRDTGSRGLPQTRPSAS